MTKKWPAIVFTFLVILALLTPFLVFKDLLFPFVTSKAFYLRILVELTLPFYVLLLLQNPKYRPSLKNPLTVSVLASFIINLVAGIVGVNPLRSIWGNFERMGGVFYLGHLTLLYFYVLCLGQISSRYLRFFLHMVIGLGAAVSLDGVMVQLTHNHFLLSDPSYPRVSGSFGNPIFIASFLILPMFLAVFFAVSETVLWKKIVYWIVILLQAWVIFLSQTRGSVVGLGIGIFAAAVLYVIFNPAPKIKLWGGTAVLAFGAMVVLLFSLHSHLPQGTMLSRVFNLNDTNTEARFIQWGVALKGYKDHPLFGVGPENYYVISNKYYNPEIYKYDPSWFDKPHNYVIEVLVTSGILGFLAYAGIFVFSIFALWASFKRQILLLSEFCVLVCGLLVYEIQNLFVFDTVAASMAFFIFVGFMGYLWYESYSFDSKAGKTEEKKNTSGLGSIFIYTVFALSGAVVLYLVYVGNVTGMQVAKEVNYGYAYSAADPQIAKAYFQSAANSTFNFDPIQFASKYSDSAISLASSPGNQSAEFVNQNLQDALNAEKTAITRVPNDPTAWQTLANLYLASSLINKTALDPAALAAAQQAVSLAPKRPEPAMMLSRIYIAQNNFAAAQTVLEQLIANIPQNKDAKLQLALLYFYQGQNDKALEIGQAMLASGYVPAQPSQIDWMGQAYDKKENYAAAAGIYEMAVKLDPGNLSDQWALAQDYAKLGKKDQAKAIAQTLIAADPKDAQTFQNFLKSLK